MSVSKDISPRQIASINPATGQVLERFASHSPPEVERRIGVAAKTFLQYRRTTFSQRSAWLNQAAEILEREKTGLARTMTLEMGKTIKAAVQEVEKCVQGCRFYAQHGASFLASDPEAAKRGRAYVRYEPLGPILAVMPWNFPFWQVFRFAAPAMMAGNVGLLKHASNVPRCALNIERVLHQAGFPEGAFQTLLIGSELVQRVIEDERVRAVTLTGSVAAGSKVAAAAGREIKKTVLELGGSDPFIVMPSADIEKAAATAIQARTINNGQSCIAAKRFILHRTIASEFQKWFIERMAALKVGDPLDEKTDIGPLATEEVREGLQEQVDKTVALGAKVLLGGGCVQGPGFFFAPTVLSEIPAASPAAKEELFGPVASLFVADGIEQAIEIANGTPFGLGASAWTQNRAEQDQFVAELDSGMVFINSMVASDPRIPFGGIKRSGYGRELSGEGIREFVNIKTVVIERGDTGLPQTE